MLRALAAYQPMPPKWDEQNKLVAQKAKFLEGPVYEAAQRVGRFYYIAYHAGALEKSRLLRRLGHTCTTILTYEESAPYGEFETVCLRQLKVEMDHG